MHAVVHRFVVLFFQRARDHRHLHSFPTRRSSDLRLLTGSVEASVAPFTDAGRTPFAGTNQTSTRRYFACSSLSLRSEEHTSELQSQFQLVYRLLLEEKKNTTSPSTWSTTPSLRHT